MEEFFRTALIAIDDHKVMEILNHMRANGCESYEDLKFLDCPVMTMPNNKTAKIVVKT
jgi:hypothetical protein